MWDAVECMIPKDQQPPYKAMCVSLAEAVYERAMTDHGLRNEMVNGVIDETRVWWVQAETLLGFANAFDLTGQEYFRQAVQLQWQAIQRMMVDPREDGEWFWSVDEQGHPTDKPIVEEWKCPYHNGRMCLRIIEQQHH